MNGDKVVELSRNQVWDEGRGGFFVKLRPTKQRYKGRRIYQDAFGRRIAIRGTS